MYSNAEHKFFSHFVVYNQQGSVYRFFFSLSTSIPPSLALFLFLLIPSLFCPLPLSISLYLPISLKVCDISFFVNVIFFFSFYICFILLKSDKLMYITNIQTNIRILTNWYDSNRPAVTTELISISTKWKCETRTLLLAVTLLVLFKQILFFNLILLPFHTLNTQGLLLKLSER